MKTYIAASFFNEACHYSFLFTDKPYFSEVNKTIERLKNETSFIKCEADADPAARYTWYRNDSVVTTLSGSSAKNLENGTIEV